MAKQSPTASLRDLPKLDALLSSKSVSGLVDKFGRALIIEELRKLLEVLRSDMREGGHVFQSELTEDALGAQVERRVASLTEPIQCRVINATGVILHTSLGRAPLPESAVKAAVAEATGYSCLELDRSTGKRSDRDKLVNGLIERITGAEAATVVNNNAAATMIILNTLAEGKEVVCSRAHMVEIGGSYRMPDVMRKAACKLVEVGTTNKTKAGDYEEAITDNTTMLLKVHTSNYKVIGFTTSISVPELVPLAKEKGLLIMNDLGSGSLVDLLHRRTMLGLGADFGAREAPAAARALVSRPRVVFADEPTGELDSRTGAGIMELLGNLNAAGTTLLTVTHDPEVASRASRIVEMSDGEITGDRRSGE